MYSLSPLCLLYHRQSTVYMAQDPHETDSFYLVQNLLTGTSTQRFVQYYSEVLSYEQQFITAAPYRHTNPR